MLGEGEYTVLATDRGGVVPLGEVRQITNLQFERRKDDTSECRIVITGPDSKCCDLLGDLRSVRHEIVVHRNGHRVWEGPITRLGYKPGEVQIDARDITWFMSRRALEHGFDHTGVAFPAIEALYDIILLHYPPGSDPYNVGRFVTRVQGPADPRTAAMYRPYTRTLFNLLEQYASRGGMDYTVTGRRLIMVDAQTRGHVLPKMTDEHLSSSINLTEYGMELKTRSFITNSETSRSEALAPQQWLDYYGPVDFVDNNIEENDGREWDAEDEQAMEEVATRILQTGYPTPVRLWIDDDARLDPCYPVEFDDLQAGAWLPIQTTDTCRKFAQWQKLQDVKVTWIPGSESVNVTLIKAPDDYYEPVGTVSVE